MRFDETSGRRAEAALELLAEGRFISFRGLGLHLLPTGVLECTVSIESAPEQVHAAAALRELSYGKEMLAELSNGSESFAAVINSRPKTWELWHDYGMGAIRLCTLDDEGGLVWAHGWPKGGPAV